MRKWLIRGAVVAGLVVIWLILRATVFAPAKLKVRVAKVERGTVEETVSNTRAGTVKARRRAALSPEIGGRVTAIPHRKGARVERGDLLLQLDDSTQRAQLVLAERDRDSAKAERDRACLAADRAAREESRLEHLAQEQIVSTDALDQATSNRQTADAACRAARANVERAGASVRVAQTTLSKMRLLAPFAGIVAEVRAEVGEWVTPSPPAMMVPAALDLIDPTSIYISAPMDEVDSARIHKGQPARVTVDSFRGQHFAGTVTEVSPYVLDVEEQNRTVEIEVELNDSKVANRLLPGTSADVEVILQVRDNVLRIPTGALIEGNRVLVLADGTLHDRHVEIGVRNWDFTEITGGLEAGEQVVTSLDKEEVKAGAEAVAEQGETARHESSQAP